MQRRELGDRSTVLWSAVLSVLYIVWALFVLDIPDMPNPHAADIGFITLWALMSTNVLGALIFLAVTQVCWHTGVWFFSPAFHQLSTGAFVALILTMLLAGVLQWSGVALLGRRLYRRIRGGGA